MKRHAGLKAISAQIKAARVKRKITLPHLAEAAGISKGNLSKIEAKASNLSMDTFLKLADALKMNPTLLLP